jgi:hypothetical protein
MKSNLVRTVLFSSGLALVSAPLSAKDWAFALTPYLWFAGLKGEVATTPPLPPGPIDISPSEALSDTEASFMLWFDARRGRYGVFADFLYSDVRSDSAMIPELGLNMGSVSKTTLLSIGFNYELFRKDGAIADVMVGGRYWDIDATLSFSGGGGVLDGRSIHHTESWVDPFIALKGRTFLGKSNFYAGGAVAVGGFNVGSDMFYDLTGNIGYQWNKSIGTSVGYRYYDVDYEDGEFLYDVAQSGWTVSLTWLF